MTIRTCSKRVRAAICPSCGSCRVPITCPLAADGLAYQAMERAMWSNAKLSCKVAGLECDAAGAVRGFVSCSASLGRWGARHAPQQDRLPRKLYGETARGQPHAAAQRCGSSRRRQSTAPSGRVGSPPGPATVRRCRTPMPGPHAAARARPDAQRTVGRLRTPSGHTNVMRGLNPSLTKIVVNAIICAC